MWLETCPSWQVTVGQVPSTRCPQLSALAQQVGAEWSLILP